MRKMAVVLVAVAAVFAIAASAQAAVWTYGFNQYSIGTDWGHSTQTTSVEGWNVYTGSSNATWGEIFQYDSTHKGMQTTWYKSGGKSYAKARISYALGGGTGNLATIGDMATADLVKYTWSCKTGTDGGSSQGVQWRVAVYEGATSRIDLGIPNATRVTANPGPAWQLTTSGGTYTAVRKFNTSEQLLIEMLVDLRTSTTTVYFNGVADAGLTNVSVAGAGVDLRNAKDVYFDSHGGNMVEIKAETMMVPEPATMALLLVGGIGALLRRKRN